MSTVVMSFLLWNGNMGLILRNELLIMSKTCGGTRKHRKKCWNTSKLFLHCDLNVLDIAVFNWPCGYFRFLRLKKSRWRPPYWCTMSTSVCGLQPPQEMFNTYNDSFQQTNDLYVNCYFLFRYFRNPICILVGWSEFYIRSNLFRTGQRRRI